MIKILHWWLFGYCIDEPFSQTKDGYTPFLTLAGFALAQSAALTIVARDEKHTNLVLAIYLGAILFTAGWVSSLLRSKRQEICKIPTASNNGVDLVEEIRTVRAFDFASITFGRWTLWWIFGTGSVMAYLGLEQLLPNQTNRVAYTKNEITISPVLIHNVDASAFARTGTGNARERRDMDEWLDWFKKAERPPEKKNKSLVYLERLIWIEQKDEFLSYYKTFSAQLSCGEDFTIGARVAFLVRREPGSFRAVYRQMRFKYDYRGKQTDVIELEKPDPGESLIILALVQSKPGREKDVPADPKSQALDLKIIISK